MRDVVAVAEHNYVSVFRLLAEVAPGGVVVDDRGALHLHTGAAVPTFNPTIVRSLPRDVDTLLESASAFHTENASPAWVVAVRASDAARFAPAARAFGLTLEGEEPFMVLDPIPTTTTVPRGLHVHRAGDVDDVRAHFELVCRCFGMPVSAIEAILVPGLVDDRIHLLIGEIDGELVATSMLAVTDGAGARCAGIYNVGTVESHRSRGIGEAMTAYAADLGRSVHGCEMAALQASVMAYSLYERMGYREVARWQVWAPGPAEGAYPRNEGSQS